MRILRAAGVLAGVAGCLAALGSVEVIPEGQAAVVERFGRYSRTFGAGVNLRIPGVDSIRTRLDKREQILVFPIHLVSAQDGVGVPIQVGVMFRVDDPYAAAYNIASFIQALEQRMLYELYNSIATLESGNAIVSLRELSERIHSVLAEAATGWGLKITWFGLRAGHDRDRTAEARDDPNEPPSHPGLTTIVVDRRTTIVGTGDNYTGAVGHGNLAQGPHQRNQMNVGGPQDQPTPEEIAEAILTVVRSQAATGVFSDPQQAIASAEEISAAVALPQSDRMRPERFRQAAAQLISAVGAASSAAATLTGLIDQIRQLAHW